MNSDKRSERPKKLIGITGNAGAGKSTVARFFECWGAYVIDADRVGHQVLEDPYVRQQLRDAFGPEIFTPDGHVDRKKLGQHVFQDPEALKTLNQIVRGPILQRINHLKAQAPKDIVVVDAALIFEYGLEQSFDVIVVVTAPEKHLIDRFQKKTGYPREIAAQVVRQAQISQEEKARKADYVIHNDGTFEALKEQAWKVWRNLLEMGPQQSSRTTSKP